VFFKKFYPVCVEFYSLVTKLKKGINKMGDKIKIQSLALITVFMMIILSLVLKANPVQAFGSGFKDRGGYNRDSKPNENKLLNLSPEQEAQLKGLRVKFLEETAYLRSEIPIKLGELRTLWTNPKPDKDRINAKKKEIIELYTELQIKATENRVLAQNFLTPEQVEKLPVFGLHLEIETNLGLHP
jgi:Spy/CpxP family protein refolding chaperone